MRWFAYQRHPGGRKVPALFDERPDKEWDNCKDVIWESVREIPVELRGFSTIYIAKHLGSA